MTVSDRSSLISFMWKRIGTLAALLTMLAGVGAQAKDVAVDLELVLAVDISGSIDEMEARLQREGYVNAILHPEVLNAIKGGMLRRVAVTYVEWAGLYQQKLVDWHLIEDEASARAFARKLAEVPIHQRLDLDQRGDQLRAAPVPGQRFLRRASGHRRVRRRPQ